VVEALPPDGDVVRVLELEPRSVGLDVRCRVRLRRPDDSYEALSYSWGDTMITECITVDDKPWDVTKSLGTALRCLRYETNKRILWVDAICINQRDNDDMNRIIGMMPEIYRMAERVLAFLGDGHDFSDLFNLLHLVGEAQDIDGDIDDLLLAVDLPLVITQMLRLLDEPWWSRIWIIQEFAYASHDPLIGYGRKWMNAYQFLDGFNALQERLRVGLLPSISSRYQISLSQTPRPHLREWYMLQMRYSLLLWRTQLYPVVYKVSDLLRDTRGYQGFDMRDKIFALRSFMMEPIRTLFTPDYNMPTGTLYTKMAAYLLCVEEWGDIYNTFPIRTRLNLPSWVPDFSYSGLEDPSATMCRPPTSRPGSACFRSTAAVR